MLIGSSGDEPKNELEYSQTSRKRPPKRRRFSGRLGESNSKCLFREEVSTHYSLAENLLLQHVSSGGLQWKSIKLSGQEVVAVAYERFLL